MNNQNPESPVEILYANYGRNNTPVQATGRLQTEYALIGNSFYRETAMIARLRAAAKEEGTDVTVRHTYGGSLLAWLDGSSDVNPLPPHYRCRICKKPALFTCEGDGWDLPPLECCGQPMIRDGHGIPVESVRDILKNGNREMGLDMADSFAERAAEIIREHYSREYEIIPFDDSFRNGTRRYALIPKGEPLPELDEAGVWNVDPKELYETGYRTIIFHLDEQKEKIRFLKRNIRTEPTVEEVLAKPVLAIVEAQLREEIREAGGTLLQSDGLSFGSLLKLIGYLRSSHTEDNPVYLDGNGKLSDVFTCREEVWQLISKALKPEYGIGSDFAAEVAGRTRRGGYVRNRMDPEIEKVLRGLGIEERWITQMKETLYLPPKADLINQLTDMLELTWYELQGGVYDDEGDFVLHHGILSPSESYLMTHELPNYSPDDLGNKAYLVTDDEDVLLEKRVCERCGAEFTLAEALVQCRRKLDYPSYLYENNGRFCGNCVAESYKARFCKDE